MQHVILLAEHEADLRETMARSLRGAGYLVLALGDETMVPDTARNNPISLIILDMASLELEGREIYRQLRTTQETARIPILFLFNDETQVAHIKSEQSHLYGFLLRPFAAEKLLTHVQAQLPSNRGMQRIILLAEQDARLRETMAHTLQKEGYLVLEMGDETTVIETARHSTIALVILDPASLEAGGLEVCRQFRVCEELAHIPMLLLVNSLLEIPHIERLGVIANDYLVKPFPQEELQACVRTLLRVGRRNNGPKRVHAPLRAETFRQAREVLVVDDLRIDVDRHQVTRSGQQLMSGSGYLFDLLLCLVRHRGMVLRREQLLQQIWGSESAKERRKVDVYVHTLRRKLEDDPDHPQLIQTIPGIGYCFRD